MDHENATGNDDVTRRTYLAYGGVTVAGASLAPRASAEERGSRPDDGDNGRSGDDGWTPTDPANPRPGAVEHLIEGYTRETSFEAGDTVEFRVSATGDARYRIDVYRLGPYDGAAGRLVTSLPSDGTDTAGREQPVPEPEPETGLLECDWEVTDTLDVPTQWPTGLYLAEFVLTSGEHAGESTAHPFVVRERSACENPSKILVKLPFATSQAYNGWGGKSLYDHTSTGDAGDYVSFDRPFAGSPSLRLLYALHLIRFLEAEGYDVSYVTNRDVHRNPAAIQERALVIVAGHDEYWSATEYDALEEARDSGTNLAFLGANIGYWQVRYTDDGLTMIGYKENAEDDPLAGTRRETDLFRNVGRPECELMGVMSLGAGLENFPDYTVQEEAMTHPWMEGTGFEAGDEIVGVVGHEWGWIRDGCAVPGDLTNFFHYEAGSSELSIANDQDADAVAYEAPSGARVFSAGSLGYVYRLDPDPSWDVAWPYNQVREYKPEVLDPDPRLQRFQRNVIDDLQRCEEA